MILQAARVGAVKPSKTLSIAAKAKRMKDTGMDVVDFSVGEPDFDTPQHIKDAAKRALDAGFVRYTATEGILELRKEIAIKLKKENGVDYSPNQIQVSSGAKMVLYNTMMAIIDAGDEVLVPDPFWVSYPAQILLAGGVPVYIPTKEEHGFVLKAEDIEKHITKKTKAIIINTPNNPTGAIIDKSTLKAIGDLAVKHDIAIISDEVYEKILYEGEHTSISSLGEDIRERTILVNGFSKTYAMTGWRLGYAAGPEDIIKAMNKVQSHSVSCPTSFVQKAGIEALSGTQESVKRMVMEFRRRRDYVVKRLNDMENVSCVTPKGAFYVFPRFMFDMDSVTFADYILDNAYTALVPGGAFSIHNGGYQRISYATSMENLKKGLDRVENALKGLKATS